MWTFLFLIFVLGVGLTLWEYAGRHLMRDIGTPSYAVLERYREYEIREYDPFVSVEVAVSGDTEEAMSVGFSILSAYLSQLEDGGEPVVQESAGASSASEGHLVAFALPSRYTTSNLPKPDDERMTFRIIPGGIRAALRFRGIPTDRRVAAKTTLLRKLLVRDRHVSSDDYVEAELVQYAPPHSMPIAATNEICIDIER